MPPPDRKVLLTPATRASRQVARTRVLQEEFNRAAQLHEDFILSKRGGARMNFTNKDLSLLNFAGLNLQGAVFTGSAFHHANLMNTVVDGCILFGCDLSDAN